MNLRDAISSIENDQLRRSLQDMDEEELLDLNQLKEVFSDYESQLTAIEAIAEGETGQPINTENLLDDNDNPDHAAIFQHFNQQHRFIHLLSRNGTRTERVLAYKDGYYQFGGTALLKHKFQSLMPNSVSTYHKNQVVDRAYDHRMGKKGDASNSVIDNLVDLNPPENKLNFTNGILDLETMDTIEHSPEYTFTTQIPYEYDPEAVCERWHNFLKEVLANYEIQEKKLQEWFGYCLKHWNTDFEKAALLLGPTNSGKSVILEVLEEVIGQTNTSNMGLKDIVDTPFGNQQLLGKMVNLNNDLNHHSITNTGAAKNVISGQDVDINQKEQPKFIASPNAKHIYSANYPPRDKIDDDAYYGRWLTFRLPKSIPPEEQDRSLADKLIEERKGILNWAIEGLKRLEENGQFTGARTIEETKDLWRRYGDPLARFYHHALEYQQGSVVAKSTCYDLLEEYCDAIGEDCPSKKKMAQYVEAQRRGIEQGRRTINGQQKRAFGNITLKPNARQKLLAEAEEE